MCEWCLVFDADYWLCGELLCDECLPEAFDIHFWSIIDTELSELEDLWVDEED